MSENGYPQNFEQRMERMEAFLQATVAAMHEYFKESAAEHQRVMEEIGAHHAAHMAEIQASRDEVRDLLTLQRERRFDIMALFAIEKEHRGRIEKLEGK